MNARIRNECCKRFKIIFMDLNMPVLNGIDTSLELNSCYEKKELPIMPIVAFRHLNRIYRK